MTTSNMDRMCLVISAAAISMVSHTEQIRSSLTTTNQMAGGPKRVESADAAKAAGSFRESLLYTSAVTAFSGRQKSDFADLMLIRCRLGFDCRLNRPANGDVRVATSCLCRCVLTRFIAVANAGHRFIGCGLPTTRQSTAVRFI